MALALLMWIIHLGIIGGSSQPVSPPQAPGLPPVPVLTNLPPPPPPPPTPDTGPLPSINQPLRAWSDSEAHGRLDTHRPLKRYFFHLAMNRRIPVKSASGAVLGEIIVPGDISGVDWSVTNLTQPARLRENGAAIILTPSMLQELSFRRDRLLALGVPP